MVLLGANEKLSYLIVGGFNTVIGYFSGVGIFLVFQNRLHILLIAAISNILAITISFLTYKTLVFKTKGGWLSEYLKCYLVYGSTALFGGLLLWASIDYFSMNIWFAQGAVVVATVCVSYIGHKNFTFKRI